MKRWKFFRALAGGVLACGWTVSGLGAEPAPDAAKLAEQLSSKDLVTRREAAYQLSHLRGAARPALPALLKALDDDDKQVWSSAMSAIAAMGPEARDAIPVLIERAGGRKGGGHRERDINQGGLRAADALAHIGPAAIEPLIAVLGPNNDAILRVVATRALGEMGPAASAAVPAMIQNLGVSQEALRTESAQALGDIGSAAGPALAAALQDPNPHTREGAALALAQCDPPYHAPAEAAKAAANEKDPTVRAALFAALPKTGVPPAECAALLLPTVVEENEPLRHAALNALLASSPLRKAAVPKLALLLKDHDPAVSGRAAHALGRIGFDSVDALPALLAAARASGGAPPYSEALAQLGPKAMAALLALLQGGSPSEGKWILNTLHDFGPPAVPSLIEALKSNRPALRAAAASALGEMGREATPAAPALFVLAQDPDPAAQASALRALTAIHADPTRLKPLLQTALASSSPEVRRAGAAGLAGAGGAATLGVDGLVELLSDDNAAGRLAAVQALGQLGEKAAPAVNALVARLGDASLQSSIVETLAQIGPAAAPAVPRLLEVAKDGDQRATILPVLTKIGKGAGAALPMIYEAVRDPAPDIRASGVTALAAVETDSTRAVETLAPLVAKGQSGKVRRMAAHALAQYGPAGSAAVPGLLEMLTKDTERGEAIRALKAIGVRTVPELQAMLEIHDPKVRTFACDSLGALGPEAKVAAPKLHEIADQDAAVRGAASAALKKIEPVAP